ncbi:MAG TPA: TerB family tellurite resistance protein [Cyclobacteriaceae bacterium]
MDIATKKKLNILIQLADADKHFAKVEREMILKIASDRGFPDEIVKDLISNPEPIGLLGVLSEKQKFNYLYYCIELVFADNQVFESELIFCRGIAIKLGFKKDVVDFLAMQHNSMTKEELKRRVFTEFG